MSRRSHDGNKRHWHYAGKLIDISSMEFGMTVLSHINRMASMETLVRSGDYDAEFKTMRVTPSGTVKTKTVRNTNSPIEVHGLRNPR